MPRISADSVEEHREQVHQRVFDALAELLAERSFGAISMAQLAAAAGLGRTAIYHHFHDKEAVVVAFAAHETSRYLDALRSGLDEASGPVERLRVYVRYHLGAGELFHMGIGTQLEESLSRESALAIGNHVSAVEQVLRDVLAEGVASGDFVVEDASSTVSLLHATLTARTLPTEAVEQYVLRAVGVR